MLVTLADQGPPPLDEHVLLTHVLDVFVQALTVGAGKVVGAAAQL
jgi:hypothetical protein